MAAEKQPGFDERLRKQIRYYSVEAVYLLLQNAVLNPFERLGRSSKSKQSSLRTASIQRTVRSRISSVVPR